MFSFTRKLGLFSLLLVAATAFGVDCNTTGFNCTNLDTQIKGSRLPSWGVDSGSANAYSITTIAPLGPSLRTGSSFAFIATHGNTTASTLAVDGGSTIAIKKNVSAALASGDIPLNSVVLVTYDGTNFQCTDCGLANFALATASITINGVTCTLSSTCSIGSFSGGGTSIYPTMTQPVAANFSFLNPNSYAATATNESDRLLLNVPASSLGLAYMQTAALPATPYTIDLGIQIHSSTNIVLAGLALKNSGGNSLRTYSFRVNTIPDFYFSEQSWTSVTAPGTENTVFGADIPIGVLLFLRVTDDGTTRTIYTSYNGKDYAFNVSQTHTTGVTADRVGIILYNNDTANEFVMVYHWLVSNSILPQHSF